MNLKIRARQKRIFTIRQLIINYLQYDQEILG